MMTKKEDIVRLIDAELLLITDEARRLTLTAVLVPPVSLTLDWDYGKEGQQFVCWQIGYEPAWNVLLLYCEFGFGPTCPWGFIGFGDKSLGSDSQWYSGLEDAAINLGLF